MSVLCEIPVSKDEDWRGYEHQEIIYGPSQSYAMMKQLTPYEQTKEGGFFVGLLYELRGISAVL